VNFKSCRNSLKHSGVARGKWEHAPRGASAHFYSHLKTRFKEEFRPKDALKMCIFWNKNVKITSASGAEPYLSWGLCPQIPTLLPLLTIANLSSSFLALNAFYYPQRQQTNYSKCSAFASFALIFHFKLYSFC